MSNSWTLMNSHGLVLFFIAANHGVTMREMSAALDLTERRVAQIVRDLSDAELLVVSRNGRQNEYAVDASAHFLHPTLRHITLGQFQELLSTSRDDS